MWETMVGLTLFFSYSAYGSSLNFHLGLSHQELDLWSKLICQILSGHIPDSIEKLKNLVYISLAVNRLHGPIPEFLGWAVALELLDLFVTTCPEKFQNPCKNYVTLHILMCLLINSKGRYPVPDDDEILLKAGDFDSLESHECSQLWPLRGIGLVVDHEDNIV
ncbi:putative LRR receptor-like serine/threonine-protein kinase isoform X1 [Gossypium australe]|uniref:Putative LRR receptor-like serine/threonine-protein kinase isoform X1 n=1 Tax=Gossypium australe TaxID=47621 RepID=A0A5B6WGY1_9ROSI|nr:putative LRR receptor-like serine/threonine-protein kinase isoform X1 [Gossypium australe]